jgi:hypothetical protein
MLCTSIHAELVFENSIAVSVHAEMTCCWRGGDWSPVGLAEVEEGLGEPHGEFGSDASRLYFDSDLGVR